LILYSGSGNLDTPEMRELSVAEQRYNAVMAVIADGLTLPRYIINDV
jgi:hypothetical protein